MEQSPDVNMDGQFSMEEVLEAEYLYTEPDLKAQKEELDKELAELKRPCLECGEEVLEDKDGNVNRYCCYCRQKLARMVKSRHRKQNNQQLTRLTNKVASLTISKSGNKVPSSRRPNIAIEYLVGKFNEGKVPLLKSVDIPKLLLLK